MTLRNPSPTEVGFVLANDNQFVEPAPYPRGTLLGGKYWVVRLLRVSAIGTVYDAVRENVASARVAVKVLHRRFADHENLAHFQREAAIQHPNIVTVFDFTTAHGLPLLAMESLDGRTLRAAIAGDPPFSPERAAHMAWQILRALGAAHSAGVLHGDLKSDSVFLSRTLQYDDVVKVLNFGAAKLLDPNRDEPPSPASDIYTVGCVMYEALTRTTPLIESAPRLSDVRPEIPRPLVGIVEKAMSRNPEARFQTAKEMAMALRQWRSTVHRPRLFSA